MGRDHTTAGRRPKAPGRTLTTTGRNPGKQIPQGGVVGSMFQGRTKHLGRLPAPSGTEEELPEAQRRSGVGRIGLQRLAVAGFGLGGTPEHLQNQSAVGQGPGARRTQSAIQHLVEERERSGWIAAHRESGGGGGPNAGRDPIASRIQYSAKESRG